MTEPTITSRPYSTAAACEKCVFGSGSHADWCPEGRYWDSINEKLREVTRMDPRIAALLRKV